MGSLMVKYQPMDPGMLDALDPSKGFEGFETATF
jgi:hypothetical protein